MGGDHGDVIKSVGRVFEVLELFDATRMAMTSAAIARELGYPASSTVILLKSMVNLGYLSFNPIEFTYIPTMRLFLASNWVQNLVTCDRDIFTIMNEIHSLCEETVTLFCENDGKMQTLHVLPGRHHVSIAKAGSKFSIFSNVIGQTALSKHSDYEIVQIAQKLNKREGLTRNKFDLPAMLQRVREIRSAGYGLAHHPTDPGLLILAWSVPSRLSEFSFVLSVGGFVHRIDSQKEQLVRAVRRAISRRFGAMSPDDGGAAGSPRVSRA